MSMGAAFPWREENRLAKVNYQTDLGLILMSCLLAMEAWGVPHFVPYLIFRGKDRRHVVNGGGVSKYN